MACIDCTRGFVHSGTPHGEVVNLHGLETYATLSPERDSDNGIIVIISDAFGWKSPNTRILADQYASKGGYKVYVPNFMVAPALPLSILSMNESAHLSHNPVFKFYALLRSLFALLCFAVPNRPSRTRTTVRKFFEKLRADQGAGAFLGAVGFCWGGKHVVLVAQGMNVDGVDLVDAVFTGHPSLLSIPKDISKITIPVSFALADKDPFLSIKDARTIGNIIKARSDLVDGEAKIYTDAGHGFCVRAEVTSRRPAQLYEEATEQCLSWFHRQRNRKSTAQSHRG